MQVNRFAYNLLQITKGLLGHLSDNKLRSLLVATERRPKCLPREVVAAVKRTLALGITLQLAGARGQDQNSVDGGWQPVRHLSLCGEKVSSGRLWERWSPEDLGLQFSANTLDFLLWLTSSDLLVEHARWTPRGDSQTTLGDEVFLTQVYGVFQNMTPPGEWSRRHVFPPPAMCALMYPQYFIDRDRLIKRLNFMDWFSPEGQWVLECWQGQLAERVVAIEKSKQTMKSPKKLQAIGDVQTAVLEKFLQQADEHHRRDLCRFLLVAASRLLKGTPSAATWTNQIDVHGLRLAERQKAYLSALSFLRTFVRLDQWQQEARGTGYLDEEYQAAQLWKSDWEALDGDGLMAKARQTVREGELIGGGM